MSGTENVQATQKYITSFDARRLAKLPEHRMCLPPVHYQSTKSERSVRISSFSWIAITYALILGETPLHMPSKKGCNKAARRRLAHGVVLAAKANVTITLVNAMKKIILSKKMIQSLRPGFHFAYIRIAKTDVYRLHSNLSVQPPSKYGNSTITDRPRESDRPSGKAFLTTPLKLLCSHHLRVFLTFQVYKSKITPRVGKERMSGHDSKYFSTTKKGEIPELKEELNSQYKDKRKDAVKKDSQDPNPLIRALAVRTMGCIRVDKITEYLCDPLQRCLKVDVFLATP
ncbi:hypothetical protein ACFE04_021855 [Oxalis oulophora]